jgi:hypothetical protein
MLQPPIIQMADNSKTVRKTLGSIFPFSGNPYSIPAVAALFTSRRTNPILAHPPL